MAEIKNVTGTAFIVAEYRAEENSAPNPLYRDSIVELFLNDATRQAAASALVASPSVKEGARVGWGECNEPQHSAMVGFALGFLRHPNLR